MISPQLLSNDELERLAYQSGDPLMMEMANRMDDAPGGDDDCEDCAAADGRADEAEKDAEHLADLCAEAAQALRDANYNYLAHTRRKDYAMAPSGPIELRQYLRLATLEDIAAGLQPIRQQTARGLELFAPPVLQFRYKTKTETGVEWSEWSDVRFAREGDGETH